MSVCELVEAGLAMGVLPVFLARGRPGLAQVSPRLDEDESQLWCGCSRIPMRGICRVCRRCTRIWPTRWPRRAARPIDAARLRACDTDLRNRPSRAGDRCAHCNRRTEAALDRNGGRGAVQSRVRGCCAASRGARPFVREYRRCKDAPDRLLIEPVPSYEENPLMKLNWRKMAAHAVVTATALAAGSAFAADLKEVRFGVEASYAPFEYKTPDGKLAGFDIDVGNAVCAKLKVKCVWVENAFDGLIPALQARKFDAINSDMTITEQRRKAIDFTDPIYTIPNQLIAKAGSALLPTPASLKGKRVGVLQGTIQEAYAKKRWAPAGVEVVPYQTQDLAYEDLKSGRLDATFQDSEAGAKGFLSKPQGAGFAFAGGHVSDTEILGIGVGYGLRKGDAQLKTALNQALKDLKADGTIDGLAKQYFSVPVTLK
jgi:lysine/arginine/ornithine transport system substrate-binding protein